MPLEPEDQQHLTRAEGWTELGDYVEANTELDEITPEVRHLPEVLAVRMEIYRALKKWELMQVVAKQMAQYNPKEYHWWICWAFATRRAENIESARIILLTAFRQHPREPLIPYNLACYECQMGKVDEAKEYLQQAFKLSPDIRILALEYEDLQPLWDSL